MWSKTRKVINISQKDSVEIKIEVSVKEANGDNSCSRDTPINKEFPKPPSHPRHNDYPTKK